jgi:ribulose-phosphate 3-epimerase
MAAICPTVTAFDPHEYRVQMERLELFCERVHIDLMDGIFTPTVSPGLDQVWWPEQLIADIHLMYEDPNAQIPELIRLKPKLVVIHQEAQGDHQAFADQLHAHGIKVGLALLHDTLVEEIQALIPVFDHVLVFSGDLGKHGGVADMAILQKVSRLREYRPDLEIGWDGGVNDENAAALLAGGVDVLNVGGFIQNATDPAAAYAKLKTISKGA